MVKIRLMRRGAAKRPSYRVVVSDSRSPRDGRFIENIGTYNPKKAENNFAVNLERAKHWISKGAKPSETVASFVRKSRKAAAAK